MNAPFPLPALRTIAAISPGEADSLLALAERTYRLHSGQGARQGLRRVAAYRRFLKLSPMRNEPEEGAAESNTMVEHRRAPRQDLFRLGELRPSGWSYPLDCLVREASVLDCLTSLGKAGEQATNRHCKALFGEDYFGRRTFATGPAGLPRVPSNHSRLRELGRGHRGN
jgi:hypothetical protein